MRLLADPRRQVAHRGRAGDRHGQSSAEHLRLLELAAGQRLVERNGCGSRLTGPAACWQAVPRRPALGAGERSWPRSPVCRRG
jgi:hypothetical protein